MKKVITYGTYDLLHVGHINLLKRAKALGDYLLVVLSTDEFNALKHKTAYHSYEDRKQILESIRYVDEVIPETCWEQKISDVVDNHIDKGTVQVDLLGLFGRFGRAPIHLNNGDGAGLGSFFGNLDIGFVQDSADIDILIIIAAKVREIG